VLFHNIVTEPVDPFDRVVERLPVNRFARDLDFLLERYDVVGLDDALAPAAGARERPRLVLTFDDGFAGVFNVAWPLLRERGLTATVFVLTDDRRLIDVHHLLHFERLEIACRLTALDSLPADGIAGSPFSLATAASRAASLKALKAALKRMPEPRQRAATSAILNVLGVPDAAIRAFAAEHPSRFDKLTREQIQALVDDGWTVGGHTQTHPSLGHLTPSRVDEEVSGNARGLAAVFGASPRPFAYPYGGSEHVNDIAEDAVRRAGFTCAFTTQSGDNGETTNAYRLHRFSMTALQQDALGHLGAAQPRAAM
jgi:peptidoglycan/xylan/chitin deacetylase (PgdA/CDA1 family)